jgi:hypothetical protein
VLGYQYLQVAKDTDMQERGNTTNKCEKGGNHDLQPVSVVLKQSIKAHILYSTCIGAEFGVAYEIVISRSRLLRELGAQESSPTIFSPSEIVSVSGV